MSAAASCMSGISRIPVKQAVPVGTGSGNFPTLHHCASKTLNIHAHNATGGGQALGMVKVYKQLWTAEAANVHLATESSVCPCACRLGDGSQRRCWCCRRGNLFARAG